MSVAYLFPGQGSHQPGMLQHLPEEDVIKNTLDEASEALNESVILMDSEQKLRSTTNAQLCLLIAGVASARTLNSERVVPSMVAGHSVGAFAAAVTAGVLSFNDALHIVKKRGEMMEESYSKGYGMGVIIGLSQMKIKQMVTQAFNQGQIVYLSNINSSDQVTISGTNEGIHKVLDQAKDEGARKAEKLNVHVPSHCPLMNHVAEGLYKTMEMVDFSTPNIPYAGIYKARALRNPKKVKEDLALSVSHPVRWHEVMSLYYELGVRLFVEMPPGHVLSDFSTRAFPSARSISISENGINTARILIKRQQKL